MAETFLPDYTREIIGKLLAHEPDSHGSIGQVAAWADGFAHTKEGAYSYQWHWIDAEDNVSALAVASIPYFWRLTVYSLQRNAMSTGRRTVESTTEGAWCPPLQTRRVSCGSVSDT